MISNYIEHCSRIRIADVSRPYSGLTLGNDGSEARIPIVDRRSAFLSPMAIQRVPVVKAEPPGHGVRFVCVCGRLCTTLYCPRGSEYYECQKCSHITYKQPSSGELAHKQYVRELIAKHGLEAVSKMAREGLQKRLDAARENDQARNG